MGRVEGKKLGLLAITEKYRKRRRTPSLDVIMLGDQRKTTIETHGIFRRWIIRRKIEAAIARERSKIEPSDVAL